MSLRCFLCFLAPALVFGPVASSQAPSVPHPFINVNIASLPNPPVPADPLELVTSGAQSVQDADQRAATTQLLTNAHNLSNVRAQPYHLKTTFVSYGSSASDGSWTLDDVSPGRGVYRWTAQGPTYAGVNLYVNDRYYSNQPSGALPLRLTQVRGVIFFDFPMAGPYASMRTASGYLNGVALRCVLVMPAFRDGTLSSGRDWHEPSEAEEP
jgi:hypothetical protein